MYSKLHTYICCNFGGHNLVLVVAKIEVQMREEVGTSSAFYFVHNEVLFRCVTHVSPHGQIFDKHLKKVIVLNGMLQLLQFGRVESHDKDVGRASEVTSERAFHLFRRRTVNELLVGQRSRRVLFVGSDVLALFPSVAVNNVENISAQFLSVFLRGLYENSGILSELFHHSNIVWVRFKGNSIW